MRSIKINTPKPAAYFPLSILLAIPGLIGLLILFRGTEPTLFPRILFFVFMMLTFSGLGLMPCAYLNAYLTKDGMTRQRVVVRQATWVGMFFTVIAWFQVGRILSTSVAVVTAIGFILIEFLFLMRDKSRRE